MVEDCKVVMEELMEGCSDQVGEKEGEGMMGAITEMEVGRVVEEG